LGTVGSVCALPQPLYQKIWTEVTEIKDQIDSNGSPVAPAIVVDCRKNELTVEHMLRITAERLLPGSPYQIPLVQHVNCKWAF